jgi:hypothetical protein
MALACNFNQRPLLQVTVCRYHMSIAAHSHSCVQIGQIMLNTPNSLWKTGFAVGLVWLVVVALISLWTMYLLSVMYLERKRSMVGATAALVEQHHQHTN